VQAYLDGEQAKTDSPTVRKQRIEGFLRAARERAESQVIKGMGSPDQRRERQRAQAKPAA